MDKLDNFDFLIQIAKGFNPVTGEVFPEDDILRKPEVSTRLFKLAHDLKDEDAELTAKIKKEFQYTPEINSLIPLSETAETGKFFSNISKAIEQTTQRNILSALTIRNKVNAYLVNQGILERVQTSKNGIKYIATEYGKSCGFIVTLEPEKSEIDRIKVSYSVQAQTYILSKLPEILK